VGLREVATASGDPAELLHALVDHEVGFFRAHPHFARLSLREAGSALTSTNAQLELVTRGRDDEAMTLQAQLIARGRRPARSGPAIPSCSRACSADSSPRSRAPIR
jgi:hypothetical protein